MAVMSKVRRPSMALPIILDRLVAPSNTGSNHLRAIWPSESVRLLHTLVPTLDIAFHATFAVSTYLDQESDANVVIPDHTSPPNSETFVHDSIADCVNPSHWRSSPMLAKKLPIRLSGLSVTAMESLRALPDSAASAIISLIRWACASSPMPDVSMVVSLSNPASPADAAAVASSMPSA